MENPLEFSKPPEALKSEHLKEGINPIMACVGTGEQFKFNIGISFSGAHDVDYYEKSEVLEKKKFKNAGADSYVISPIDNFNKFSLAFRDCTGLVVAGQDKETGEEISFLSHQDPRYFLSDNRNSRFFNDLRQRLLELKKMSAERTIDAVIIGGNYMDEEDCDSSDYKGNYRKSIELISSEVRKILGFEPVVITGPKIIPGKDNVFYENKKRRLYITRPEVGQKSTESFSPSNLEGQEKKWAQ